MSVQEIIQQAQTLSTEEQTYLIKALVDMVAYEEKPFNMSVWEQAELDIDEQNKYIGNIPAYIKASGASDKLIKKTLTIVRLLEKETQPYQYLDLPPIGVSTPEDDEILIGWSIPHVRVGFSIEGEGAESSWYAVTDGTIDATNAWGYLSDYESEEKLVAFLVSYIVGTYRKYNK